jgi:hypothetical protein
MVWDRTRVCCLCDGLTGQLPRTCSSQKTMLSTRVFQCPQPQSVCELCTDWTKAICLKKTNLKKNAVSWNVVACSPAVHQCFRVTNILPLITCLAYPEEAGSVFLQKVTGLLPDYMASQTRKQCFSWLLLWELQIQQNFKELKSENYLSFIQLSDYSQSWFKNLWPIKMLD